MTIPLLKVLNAMLEAPDQDLHGFKIIKLTGLKSGTLYPLLARLENAGWVESDWEKQVEPGRPRRRYYRLTGLGVEAARRELSNLPGRTATPARTPTPPRPSMAFGAVS